jgi:sigma-B regulation protein RsbU (phosphoserine phosphatase)
MLETQDIKLKRNLNALVEFSKITNSSIVLPFILNNILLTCMGKFFSTRGLIALNESGSLELKASKGISENNIKDFPQICFDDDVIQDESFQEYLKKTNLVVTEKIVSSEKFLGIICLGEKLNKQEYSQDDLDFLRTILNISASAVQNSLVINELKDVNRKLDSRIGRLNILFELSKEFGLFSGSSKVSRLLAYTLLGQFLVSKYAIINLEGSKINILESKFQTSDLINAIEKYDCDDMESPIKEESINENCPEIGKLGVKLVVPMQLGGKTKGLILLGERMNKIGYTDADIEFIYSVGSLATISIENKRLFKEALEKQKLEEELEIARGIQKNLLPREIPIFESFEIAAVNNSSKQVGGDYFDVMRYDEDKFFVAIGDVSGKGVPAALLMANLQAFLKTICRQGLELEAATELLNDLVSENTSDGKFITFFWALFDDKNKKLTYVNAGHNPPLLIRNKEIIKLEKGGIILGVTKTPFPYESENIELKHDDVIILYTDGVTEAMNAEEEEFSDRRLESLSLKLSEKSAAEILNSIQDEINTFTYGTPQSDDITIIALKVK